MPEKEYYNFQDYDSQYLHKVRISSLDLDIENHWSPYIEKELLAEIKSPINIRKKPQKSELKCLCLLAGVVGLLSIGMWLQVDTIAQALRKIVRISVEEAIQINNR